MKANNKPKKSVCNTCWFIVSRSYITANLAYFSYKGDPHITKEEATSELLLNKKIYNYYPDVVDSKQYIYYYNFDMFMKTGGYPEFSWYIVEREVIEVPYESIGWNFFHRTFRLKHNNKLIRVIQPTK